MSSRDLVGRPLVPFFDANDNVNESLDVDDSTRTDVGLLDVDARVWDRELGYFVYPDGTPSPAPVSSTQHPIPQHSAPIAIPPRATTKTLLTPDMLFSRSAPTAGINGMDHLVHSRPQSTVVTTPPVVVENGGQTRSASAKRASQRTKRRSNTPTKTAKSPSVPPQSSTDVSSSSSDNATNDRKANNATPKKNRSKKKNNGQENGTEDLSANGKWAWSAFQSSPDPKSLPLPPFAVGGSPGLGAAPPPADPPKIEERLDPPLAPPAPASSLEHSMTQDLRRLLNIGS